MTAAAPYYTDPLEDRPQERAGPQGLRLEVKVKNNILWRAIHDRYPSVRALCAAHERLRGHYARIHRLIRFKDYPFKKKHTGKKNEWYYSNEYREVCFILEEVLGIPAEELFPNHLYYKLVGTETERVVEVSSFTALSAATQYKIGTLPASESTDPVARITRAELHRRLNQVMCCILSYREQEVLKLRRGLEGNRRHTLREIAHIFKILPQYVKVIENKAVRKLSGPTGHYVLREFVDPDAPSRPIGEIAEEDWSKRRLRTSVYDLELTAPAKKALRHCGVYDLGDLTQKTAAELLAAKGFNKKFLAEVRQMLRERWSLKLRGD